MTDEQVKAAMQEKLMTHFGNDLARAKGFVADCKVLGLDLSDPDTIRKIADRTPAFMNLLTHELWGTFSTFARVMKALKE